MSKDEEYVRLQVMPGEQRGDDLGSSVDSSFGCDDLIILAFSYYIKPGDEEEYLTKEAAQRLKEIRTLLQDIDWKETLVNTLDNVKAFPVTFSFFEQQSYYQKMDIVQAVNNKSQEERDEIQQKFDELYKMRKDKQKSIGSMVD